MAPKKSIPNRVLNWIIGPRSFNQAGAIIAFLLGISIAVVPTNIAFTKIPALKTVDPINDPVYWMDVARAEAYGACYNGCTDCDDAEFAFKACKKTAQVEVKGVICDANKIWNWKERYPEVCLKKLGEKMRGEGVKHPMGFQAALLIADILVGLFVGIGMYRIFQDHDCFKSLNLWLKRRSNTITTSAGTTSTGTTPLGGPVRTAPDHVFTPYDTRSTHSSGPSKTQSSSGDIEKGSQGSEHSASKSNEPTPSIKPTAQGSQEPSGSELLNIPFKLRVDSPIPSINSMQVDPPTPSIKFKSPNGKYASAVGIAAFSSFAMAHICTGKEIAVTNHYFTNTNKTVFGVVQGRIADCYEYDCHCQEHCMPSSAYRRKGCNTKCDTCTGVRTGTAEYVNRVLPKVRDCGFRLVDEALPWEISMRVANANIEKNFWVTISVHGFNVTEGTDPLVMCLHAIGG